jgi:hypothetical protein
MVALVIAIISAVFAGVSVLYNRRLTRASEKSADNSARSADAAVGPLLRLRLECHPEGWEPWTLPCEMKIDDGVGYAEVPKPI